MYDEQLIFSTGNDYNYTVDTWLEMPFWCFLIYVPVAPVSDCTSLSTRLWHLYHFYRIHFLHRPAKRILFWSVSNAGPGYWHPGDDFLPKISIARVVHQCKSHETCQFWLWMTKSDIGSLQWFFQCLYVTVEMVDSFHMSNCISTAFVLNTGAHCAVKQYVVRLFARPAGLPVACLTLHAVHLTAWCDRGKLSACTEEFDSDNDNKIFRICILSDVSCQNPMSFVGCLLIFMVRLHLQYCYLSI